jgi:hypothetical protein
MKINFVPTLIGLFASALISYGFYVVHVLETNFLLSIGSFIFLGITSVFGLGISFEFQRTTTNIRVVSSLFFALGLITNLVFAFSAFSVPSYVIVNGILFLAFLLIIYSIEIAKQ